MSELELFPSDDDSFVTAESSSQPDVIPLQPSTSSSPRPQIGDVVSHDLLHTRQDAEDSPRPCRRVLVPQMEQRGRGVGALETYTQVSRAGLGPQAVTLSSAVWRDRVDGSNQTFRMWRKGSYRHDVRGEESIPIQLALTNTQSLVNKTFILHDFATMNKLDFLFISDTWLKAGSPVTYCMVNHNVPILQLWLDEELELRQDFRLSRTAMNALQRLLQRETDHGWGHQLETLIYVYWLAHGLSYRVVSSVFNVPKATVHRVIHRVAQNIWVNLKKAISFPQAEELQAVGQGFAQLSRTHAFKNVVGAIDGTHIRIKPPKRHQIDYLNYKGF
ncbi:hypothetical protein DPX16_8746 [Anabarilius grahami]|uniref:Nuclease HARBI1 n=1 Tax=Anabarilius grahami TaxID=495550 RepID=A0A3N0YDZ4_ANAGA|nr:hypothetical protein DPX16_8746 [Anabarilius grahami]